MSINAIILMRNKTVEIHKADPRRAFFDFRGGLYTIPSEAVRTTDKERAEVIYFENDPVPIGITIISEAKAEPNKMTILDEVILTNYLNQLVNETIPKTGSFWAFLGAFRKNPELVIGLILALAVVYSFIVGGFQI